MAWARLDDRAGGNPKLLALSDAAWRMWGCALIYCQKEMTDGFVPEWAIDTFGVKAKRRQPIVDELCAVLVHGKGPLWHRVEGGYQIHDYLDWNDSREEIEAERKASKNRKEKWRAARQGTRSETRPGMGDPSGSRPRSTIHDPQEVSKEQKPPSAPTRQLLTRFDERHQQRFGVKAAINGGKDAKRIADLWRRRQGDAITVEQLIDAFFESSDSFVLTAGFSVGVFISQIPKLIPVVLAAIAPPAEDVEHYRDECLRLHGGACEHEPAHWLRMQREAKERAS